MKITVNCPKCRGAGLCHLSGGMCPLCTGTGETEVEHALEWYRRGRCESTRPDCKERVILLTGRIIYNLQRSGHLAFGNGDAVREIITPLILAEMRTITKEEA